MTNNPMFRAGAEATRAGVWHPIATVARVNGLRLILAWDDCPTLSYHWEVGSWSRDLGWVNTYGKPFGAGEPTHWMLPDAPSTFAIPTNAADAILVIPSDTGERVALEWINAHADDQDMSHVNFRIGAGSRARAALTTENE